jgi:hypothetical protein
MNLVLLLSIILAVQLPLFTFGKSSQAKVESATSKISLTTTPNDQDASKSDKNTAARMRRNSIITSNIDDNENDDFSIKKLSREYPISILLNACNE